MEFIIGNLEKVSRSKKTNTGWFCFKQSSWQVHNPYKNSKFEKTNDNLKKVQGATV